MEIIMKKHNTVGKETKRYLIRSLPLLIPVIVQMTAIIMSNEPVDATEYDTLWRVLSFATLAVSTALIFIKTDRFKIIPWVIFAIAPALCCILLESLIRNPFSEMKPKVILLNIAFFYLVSLFFLFVTRRTWPGVLFSSLFGFVSGMTEHYVLTFRNVPLFPWDLKSVGTAATIVDNYDFSFTYAIAASICALMLILILGFKFKSKISFDFDSIKENFRKQTGIFVRVVACLLVLVILGGYVYYLNLDRSYTDFGMYPYLFTPKVVYSRNGFTVAFLSMLRYLNVSKPDGYSDEQLEALKAISDTYAKEQNEDINSDAEKPNIIVIMNEAFSDLSVLTGTELETNVPYMPFLDSLEENTVKGNLHVSVLGGNTANTEFEFLTGLSMAYLPTGSIPYQQYIDGELPSLASQLKDLGYDTLALHPYNSTGWDRNTVYPWMGFDKSIFRTALKNATILRQYVTDISVYRYIINEFGKKDDDPMFVFNVTMQNHGSYTKTYENFNYQSVTVKGLENDVKLSTYLSLIRESDDAIKYLISYFEHYDEPTIIMMFGDHQPAATVSSKLLKKYGVKLNEEDINDVEKRYIVPFYIWANYDIEEAEHDAVSVNYLSTLLVDVAGIEKTDAQAYLYELMREYPVITANVVMDKQGELYPADSLKTLGMLNDYGILQYSYLFDGDEENIFSYDE